MIEVIKLKISNYFTDNRSSKVFGNITLSLIIKIGGLGVNFILVPITISYVNATSYGIWLIISSITSWISLFDAGLSNGLKNTLTADISKKKYFLAKIHISTAYASITIISICVLFVFCCINYYVNWNRFFNIEIVENKELSHLISLTVLSFCIQFIFQTINTVLSALHETAKANFINFMSQVLILIILYFAEKIFAGSLLVLVCIFGFVPVLVLIFSNIFFYSKSLKYVIPSIKLINFRSLKDMSNLAIPYFFLQIGLLLIFQTDNIIISKILGPKLVTDFNVAYKLYSIILVIINVVITPYWSAFADANIQKDFLWMKKSVKVMYKIFIIFSIFTAFISCFSENIYKIWLGSTLNYSQNVSFAMFLYVVFYMWQLVNSFILNGLGKIKLQLITVVISSLINIPLSFKLGALYNLEGIITANTITFAIMGGVYFFQVRREVT